MAIGVIQKNGPQKKGLILDQKRTSFGCSINDLQKLGLLLLIADFSFVFRLPHAAFSRFCPLSCVWCISWLNQVSRLGFALGVLGVLAVIRFRFVSPGYWWLNKYAQRTYQERH